MIDFFPVSYRETPELVIHPTRIDDDEVYGQAVASFVVVCVDCIFINRHRGTVYLVKRKAKPMSSQWWFIGGRVYAGEDEFTAMCRCLKRETSLNIDSSRLKPLLMRRYYFKDRQQEPQDRGCDSLCYVFGLDVTASEIDVVKSNLDCNEYSLEAGVEEFDAVALVSEKVFPSIIDTYNYIFQTSVAYPVR